MFLITIGMLGWYFALAKTTAAIGVGLLGGGLTMIFTKSVVFADPLREKPKVDRCCNSQVLSQAGPRWSFWRETERIEIIKSTIIENVVFLLKWLALPM